MSNKWNRAKVLALVVTVTVTGFVLTPASFADDDCTQACQQVEKAAQNLPSPDAKSVKEYLNGVVDAGGQCVQCGINQIQGQSAPDNGQSDGSSSSSSSSFSSSSSSSGGDGDGGGN